MAKNFNELDVVCHVTKGATKTLATSAAFKTNKNEGELPFRESNLSRLEMSLLIKSGPKTEVHVFNIPAREINEVKLKTDIAVSKLMCSAPSVAHVNGEGFANSPAFTVNLLINAFKGRTPAEVLSANPESKAELLKGREWLANNLSKYPANKTQIEAIDDAINLLAIGELPARSTDTPSITSNIMTIYKREYKYKSTKDANGNNLVYSVTITCDPSKNMPFEVNVMNCYAPVITNSGGQTIVKTAEATNMKRASISLSDSEWIGLISQAYDLYQNFKTINASNAFNRVEENSYQNNN